MSWFQTRFMAMIILGGVTQPVLAWHWQDLWATKNQQGQKLMNQAHYSQAKETFERDDWRAAAAYRAGDYELATKLYSSLNNENSFYNTGNAYAHMGQYEKAVNAYNQALAINPNHEDALHNLDVVEKLLKQDKQQEKQSNQQKQNQDKQNQDKQNQDKQNQDKQNQDKQNQDKQNQDKQNQDKQNQDKQNQDKQNQDKQNQDKQKQEEQQQKNKKKQTDSTPTAEQTQAADEKQKAKEQWLHLIPDDPGGLMREKFLRDHIRRQRGWYE